MGVLLNFVLKNFCFENIFFPQKIASHNFLNNSFVFEGVRGSLQLDRRANCCVMLRWCFNKCYWTSNKQQSCLQLQFSAIAEDCKLCVCVCERERERNWSLKVWSGQHQCRLWRDFHKHNSRSKQHRRDSSPKFRPNN